ncbi:MAG: Universal stress protein family, tandem domain [Olavius algarvensis Gamma 3 endosymbiont]|nr:MAG: Universal stress protein family, tandem domain [Olavius algarvensis Gamma 3 endosymbiont]
MGARADRALTHVNAEADNLKHHGIINPAAIYAAGFMSSDRRAPMEIKNILLHLDHSKGCQNRLATALGMAKKHDALITGLFVVPDYVVPSYVEAQISVDLITDVTEKALHRARETLVGYQQLVDEAEVTMDAHVVEGQVIPILREHSKYSDLLILGQDDPEDPDNASYGLADALLFEGACACLVVPHSGKLAQPGERVLLTWNASRESARALREAMPLLQSATTVVVLSSEPDDSDTSIARSHPHADELARFLESHGIESISSGISDMDIGPSDAILGQAAEMNADLIVMGAYGHARLREIILGGVTRDLLKLSPVPIFMAH